MSVLFSNLTNENYQLKGLKAKEVRELLIELNSCQLNAESIINQIYWQPIVQAYPILQEVIDKTITLVDFKTQYENSTESADKLVYAVGLMTFNQQDLRFKLNNTPKSDKTVKAKLQLQIDAIDKTLSPTLQKICVANRELFAEIESKTDDKVQKIEVLAKKRKVLEAQVIELTCECLDVDVDELNPNEMDELMANVEKFNDWFVDFFTLRVGQTAQLKMEKMATNKEKSTVKSMEV